MTTTPTLAGWDSAEPVPGLTIDASTTRDMDDAVWVERLAEPDRWRVTVCIADAAMAIGIGSPDDVRALAMGATRYFATGNSPMLPRSVSEDRFSLWPRRRRRVLAIGLEVDGTTFQTTDMRLKRVAFTSREKLTYQDVPTILAAPSNPFHTMLSGASELALALCARRRAEGAFAFYDLHQGWVTTEEGTIRHLVDVSETIGHLIVQELMILTNAALATWAARHEVPVLFRNHTARLDAAGRAALAQELAEVRVMAAGRIELLRQRTNLLLDRASYGPNLLGHFGLALPAYLHATSPLRRFADLVTHRQILASMDGQSLPYSHDELAAIGAHLKALDDTARDRERDHYRGKAEAAATAAVDGRRLDGLDAAGFERATKMAVRGACDPPAGFVEGFVRRVSEARAPLLALTVVVTQAPRTEAWWPVLDAVLAALALRPVDAPSLIAQARSIAGWLAVTATLTPSGPDHDRRFTSRMVLGDDAGEATAAVRKGAEQLAMVRLLAAIVGRPCPELPEAPPTIPPTPTTPEPTGERDPVAELHELVQAQKLDPPTFAPQQRGPAHRPTFIVEVKVGEQRAEGRGASKQLAKREACKALLRRLARKK